MATQVQNRYGQKDGEWETVPSVIPTIPEVLCPTDAHIQTIHIVGGSSDIAVTITDQQAVPMPVIPAAITLKAGTDMVWEFTDRLAKGGLVWSASAPGVTGYVRFRA